MTPMMPPKRKITMTAPQDVFLRREAERLGITVADLVRRIIDEYRKPLEAQREAKS
jgi:tRNA uridine 5-carbamoylmethylation protein Kti12